MARGHKQTIFGIGLIALGLVGYLTTEGRETLKEESDIIIKSVKGTIKSGKAGTSTEEEASSRSQTAGMPKPADKLEDVNVLHHRKNATDPTALHPKIELVQNLSKKAILSAAELKKMQAELKNRETIQAALETLLADWNTNEAVAVRLTARQKRNQEFLKGLGFYSSNGQAVRLRTVRYLIKGLGWHGNPERDTVIRVIRAIIMADNLDLVSDPRLKKSLAGDKVELFQAVLEYEPTVAQEILESTADVPVGRLVQFANDSYFASQN